MLIDCHLSCVWASANGNSIEHLYLLLLYVVYMQNTSIYLYWCYIYKIQVVFVNANNMVSDNIGLAQADVEGTAFNASIIVKKDLQEGDFIDDNDFIDD